LGFTIKNCEYKHRGSLDFITSNFTVHIDMPDGGLSTGRNM